MSASKRGLSVIQNAQRKWDVDYPTGKYIAAMESAKMKLGKQNAELKEKLEKSESESRRLAFELGYFLNEEAVHLAATEPKATN